MTTNGPHITWRLSKHVIFEHFGKSKTGLIRKEAPGISDAMQKQGMDLNTELPLRFEVRVQKHSQTAIPKTHTVSRVGSYALLCPGCWFSSLTFQRSFRHHHNQQINTCQSAETHMAHNHMCIVVDDRLLNEIEVTGALKLQSFGGLTGKRYTNFALMCAFFPPAQQFQGLFCRLLQVGQVTERRLQPADRPV